MKLPEYKLELIPKNKAASNARHFDSYCENDLGKRFKIGGNPDFIQESEWPVCKCCGGKMTFYAQLDTIGCSLENRTMCLADCGLIYVFYCFDCNEAYAMVQSY